jgi:hypothetical protein
MPFQKGHKINIGRKSSDNKKNKLSIAHTGKIMSEASRIKMSFSKKGKQYVLGKHWKIKDTSKMHHDTWSKGKKMTEEFRKKCSIGQKRRFKNSSVWNKGKEYKQIKGENHWNWLGGKSKEKYTLDWTETLRRSIRERDNYICLICSLPQGDIAHDVHHIDYDKKNCNPNNLITLCHKCHQYTNGRRDYWKKNLLAKLKEIYG